MIGLEEFVEFTTLRLDLSVRFVYVPFPVVLSRLIQQNRTFLTSDNSVTIKKVLRCVPA